MEYDVIVVGAGIAGLTAAAYTSKNGYKTLLLEKENQVGGLVNSFRHNGIFFDGGIRAIENAGIISPMLRQLGIEIPFVKNLVSLVVGDERIEIKSPESIEDYKKFLQKLFPESKEDVCKIIDNIKLVMKYMDVLYGIENPLFMNYKDDFTYVRKTLLPWLFRYIFTIGKIEKMNIPIEKHLRKLTSNQRLIDIISQHFFENTPAFFAMSYFSMYLDYYYPKGGTEVFPRKMAEKIEEFGGEIKLGCFVNAIDAESRTIKDSNGNEYRYKKMVWAADQKSLYGVVDYKKIASEKLLSKISVKKLLYENALGGTSVLSVYLTLNVPVGEIKKHMTEHVFYTPRESGTGKLENHEFKGKEDGFAWLKQYLTNTTYEVSCPAMRDETLATEGKTGIVLSVLFDYKTTMKFVEIGEYESFKQFCNKIMCEMVFEKLLKQFKDCKFESFCSTPVTMQRLTGNAEGAITGWSFKNHYLPSVTKMSKVVSSIKTEIPDILQAGQWTFSPSGLPTSIMTGKFAADEILKKLKK